MPIGVSKALCQLRNSSHQPDTDWGKMHLTYLDMKDFANDVKERWNPRKNLYRYQAFNHNKEKYAASMQTPTIQQTMRRIIYNSLALREEMNDEDNGDSDYQDIKNGPYHHQIIEMIDHHVQSAWGHLNALVELHDSIISLHQPIFGYKIQSALCSYILAMHVMFMEVSFYHMHWDNDYGGFRNLQLFIFIFAWMRHGFIHPYLQSWFVSYDDFGL